MRPLTAALLAAALVSSAAPVRAVAAQRAVVPEDLFKMAFVSSATISHDGQRVAFVVSRADLAKNAYLSSIWIASSDGMHVAQLTRGEHDGEPAWSPDDRNARVHRRPRWAAAALRDRPGPAVRRAKSRTEKTARRQRSGRTTAPGSRSW